MIYINISTVYISNNQLPPVINVKTLIIIQEAIEIVYGCGVTIVTKIKGHFFLYILYFDIDGSSEFKPGFSC